MLEVKNLVKVYKTKGGVETRALDGVTVNFPETGLVFLLGKSGSGKSTLLNMIGGLDRPDSGEIIVKGRSSKDFSQSDFDSYRNTFIGFIFQEYNVLNEFNVEQNISLALQLQGKKNDKEAVNALLKEVDLEGFNRRKPNTLSGGQKQRIAIARALIKSPEIIMADEPTGALDSNTGKQVLETLKKLSRDKLVIIVSHDQDFAEEYGDRIIELKDGKILSDKTKEHVPPKEVNKNIQLINGNIIDIKKGSELTEADFKQIYQLIKKQDKEVLISTGDNNIAVTKKAQRISDDGKGEVFKDTKGVDVKQYDGKQTKFIRSHMPFSRSFKMGASGLKTKPVRLIFTILLSVVSFTMFGVASTLMLYNPAYSLAEAMKTVDRTSEALIKTYKYTTSNVSINDATGEIENEYSSTYEQTGYGNFGVSELNDFNNQNGNRFLGVYSLGSSFSLRNTPIRFSTVSISGDSQEYYSYAGFSGLSDSASSIITSGGARLTGSHPAKVDEIAISNYHFDLIKESGALGSLSGHGDIVGKNLDISFYGKSQPYNIKMKITGVYDFGQIPAKYDDVKRAKEASVSKEKREEQVLAFNNFIGGSTYTIGYVAPEFYEKYGFLPFKNSSGVNQSRAEGIVYGSNAKDLEGWTVTTENTMGVFLMENVADSSEFKYYDDSFNEVKTISLNDDEVLLPYDEYHSRVERSKYWEPVCHFKETLGGYSSYMSAEQRAIYEEANIRSEDELTTDFGKAYNRLRSAFENEKGGGEETSYPSDHTPEEDIKTCVDALNEMYHTIQERYYLSRFYWPLNSYMEKHDPWIEHPANWVSEEDPTATNKLHEKLSGNEDDITSEEITLFKTRIVECFNHIEDNGGDASHIYKTAKVGALYGLANNTATNNLSQYLRDLYGDEVDAWQIINNYEENPDDAMFEERFNNAANYLFKQVFDEETAPDYSFDTQFIGDYTLDSSKTDSVGFATKDVSGRIVEYKVKGYVSSSNYWSPIVVTRNAVKNYLKDSYTYKYTENTEYRDPTDAKYQSIVALNPNYSESEIDLFTSNYGAHSLKMTNETYNEVSRSTDMIAQLKTIFLIIGAVTGGLAGLLLLNFISVSISSKNKDIGILRAVGARGSDVFKIFFSESSIITLICFVLSAVAAGVTCFYINQSLSESMIGVVLLNYGLINILMILGVAVVISFIATFIPVLIASRKPPVEAIRAL